MYWRSFVLSDNKSQVTVVACINAIGQCLPPFIIFDAKPQHGLGQGNHPWPRWIDKNGSFIIMLD